MHLSNYKTKKNPTKPYNTICKVWTSVDNVLLHSYQHPVQSIDSQMHYTQASCYKLGKGQVQVIHTCDTSYLDS
jgi:hypothetical protein